MTLAAELGGIARLCKFSGLPIPLADRYHRDYLFVIERILSMAASACQSAAAAVN